MCCLLHCGCRLTKQAAQHLAAFASLPAPRYSPTEEQQYLEAYFRLLTGTMLTQGCALLAQPCQLPQSEAQRFFHAALSHLLTAGCSMLCSGRVVVDTAADAGHLLEDMAHQEIRAMLSVLNVTYLYGREALRELAAQSLPSAQFAAWLVAVNAAMEHFKAGDRTGKCGMCWRVEHPSNRHWVSSHVRRVCALPWCPLQAGRQLASLLSLLRCGT